MGTASGCGERVEKDKSIEVQNPCYIEARTKHSPVASKKEERGLLVEVLGDDEARALRGAAEATAVLLVAAQANAAARGKPNSIHAETDNSTSTR